MDFIVEELTGPAIQNNFVGRSEIIDKFHDLLREFVRGNPSVKWVHISGVAGTGKSSLLRKFRLMTEQERIATGSVEVPISPKLGKQFLTDIKQVIDEMSPEWRSFFQRYRNSEIRQVREPPEAKNEEITDASLNKMVDLFFEDLDRVDESMKEEKIRHGIFVDDLDRLLSYSYSSILSAWPLIAKRLMEEDLNLLFVTTSHQSANRYLNLKEKENLDFVLHLELDQFDFTEAELMIRRRGRLTKSEREMVVQASTRYPFDLALRQLIQSKGFDPTTLDDEIITKTFGMTEGEVSLLRDLAKHDVNYFNYEEYTRLHSEEIILNLTNALMFIIAQDGHFAFDSYSMWELVSHVYKPIDPRTEVILILNRIRDQAELGQMPSRRDIIIVENHFNNIKDNALLFELSGQLANAARAAIDGRLIHTAWELLQLATIGLEKTNDFEKLADLQESLAKGFSKVNHNYFAAKSFQKAGEYFSKAEVEWRSVTNYREAGQKYLREAEDTNPEIYHYAIRSLLKNSFESYLNANEKNRAKSVLHDAKKILGEYASHVNYFEKLEVLGD